MRLNMVDMEDILPIHSVDGGYIMSRQGDITAGWELTLPAVSSLSEDGYDSMFSSLVSAVRALPDWYIVHRQDLYLDSCYTPEVKAGYLDRHYEEHFSGRAYKTARHFLYLTKTCRSSAIRGVRSCGLFSTDRARDLDTPADLGEFVARCEEFISIVTSNALCRARKLTDEDLLGKGGELGLIGQVMMLGGGSLSDVMLEPDQIRVNDSYAFAYSISNSDDLPSSIETVKPVNSLSTARSRINMCCASPVGTLLTSHPHINNLYIVMPNQNSFLSELNSRITTQLKFSTDGANAVNAQLTQEFINEVTKEGLRAVYAHGNIISWGHDEKESLKARSDISAALSSIGFGSSRNLHSVPVLWYASIPGAATELSVENMMRCELRSAVAMAQFDSYEKGLPKGTFKFTDRLRHIPVTLDIQQAAESENLISNYNIFLDGASGTGKSFTTASLLYSMYSAGEHVFIIDIGGSYEQVCAVVNEESGGRDGIYNRWDKEHAFSFCPFHEYERWVDGDGTVHREEPSLNFLISILMTMGSDSKKGIVFGEYEETVIVHLVTIFIQQWQQTRKKKEIPVFDDFVKWVKGYLIYNDDEAPELRGTMKDFYTRDGVKVDSRLFSGEKFIVSISSYGKRGQFGFLLNTREPADLFSSRFTVFDVGELSSINNEKFFSICVLCIVNAFDLKMNSKSISDFKVMALDEAWKAISNETMAPYLRQLWKTARKYNTSAMVITQELDDILSSDVIKETILQNSDIKILMNQSGNINAFEKISGPLGLSPMETNLVLSMSGRESRSKDVFIKWGNSRAGVYTVEACPEQLWAFESNHEKKKPLFEKMKETGSMLSAIDALIREGILPNKG